MNFTFITLHSHLIIVYHRFYDNRLSCVTIWRNPVFSLLTLSTILPATYFICQEVNILNINIQIGTEEAEAFYEVPSRASQQQIQPVIVFSLSSLLPVCTNFYFLCLDLAGDLCYTSLALLPVIAVVFFVKYSTFMETEHVMFLLRVLISTLAVVKLRQITCLQAAPSHVVKLTASHLVFIHISKHFELYTAVYTMYTGKCKSVSHPVLSLQLQGLLFLLVMLQMMLFALLTRCPVSLLRVMPMGLSTWRHMTASHLRTPTPG